MARSVGSSAAASSGRRRSAASRRPFHRAGAGGGTQHRRRRGGRSAQCRRRAARARSGTSWRRHRRGWCGRRWPAPRRCRADRRSDAAAPRCMRGGGWSSGSPCHSRVRAVARPRRHGRKGAARPRSSPGAYRPGCRERPARRGPGAPVSCPGPSRGPVRASGAPAPEDRRDAPCEIRGVRRPAPAGPRSVSPPRTLPRSPPRWARAWVKRG